MRDFPVRLALVRTGRHDRDCACIAVGGSALDKFKHSPLVRRIAVSLAPLKPILEAWLQMEALVAARWAASAHQRLMLVQWGIPPQPEHFDQQINLYYQWLATRSSYWLERGVFSSLALKGGDVLELCCGDGFNARNFYSLRSRSVIACDFDPQAIRTARRKNQAPNIQYIEADIRINMPQGQFDNVIWDAAIEHFTQEEAYSILEHVKMRLAPGGILSGYTIVRRDDGRKMLSHYEYEFRDKNDLYEALRLHFREVTVFETRYSDRCNLYFWASDHIVPFARAWPHCRSAADQQPS